MADSTRVVLITTPDAATAEAIARGLVEAKLAACVNIVPGVVSHYRWEGALHKDRELLLIVKTRAGALPRLTRFVRKKHPAELPEIIALAVSEGDPRYLDWIAASTQASI